MSDVQQIKRCQNQEVCIIQAENKKCKHIIKNTAKSGKWSELTSAIKNVIKRNSFLRHFLVHKYSNKII